MPKAGPTLPPANRSAVEEPKRNDPAPARHTSGAGADYAGRAGQRGRGDWFVPRHACALLSAADVLETKKKIKLAQKSRALGRGVTRCWRYGDGRPFHRPAARASVAALSPLQAGLVIHRAGPVAAELRGVVIGRRTRTDSDAALAAGRAIPLQPRAAGQAPKKAADGRERGDLRDYERWLGQSDARGRHGTTGPSGCTAAATHRGRTPPPPRRTRSAAGSRQRTGGNHGRNRAGGPPPGHPARRRGGAATPPTAGPARESRPGQGQGEPPATRAPSTSRPPHGATKHPRSQRPPPGTRGEEAEGAGACRAGQPIGEVRRREQGAAQGGKATKHHPPRPRVDHGGTARTRAQAREEWTARKKEKRGGAPTARAGPDGENPDPPGREISRDTPATTRATPGGRRHRGPVPQARET